MKYFNFPVELLKDFLLDSRKVLDDILYYCLYTKTLEYEFEEDEPLKKLHAAIKYYRVRIGDEKLALKRGEKLYRLYEDRQSPFCGLNLKVFWDFYGNEKSDFEKACLLAFLAIKSILGKKVYCKITNEFMLARMDGRRYTCTIDKLDTPMKRFAGEYQLKKIKRALEVDWYLIYYSSRMRGFYISFEMKREDLIFEAEKKRQNVKIRRLEAEQKKAKEIAMLRIRNQFRDLI